jgi:hypothetical protein
VTASFPVVPSSCERCQAGDEFRGLETITMRIRSILLLLLLAHSISRAQELETKRSLSLRTDLLQHTVALPGLTRSFTPFSPGLRLGAVRQGRSSKYTEWRQQGFLGWYRHARLHDAFLLSGEIAFRVKLGRVFLGISGGPGYMLQLPYAPVYEYRDGVYVRSTQLMHRFTLQLAAEAGVRFGRRCEGHLRFEQLFEFPYGLNASPVLPHRLLSLGIAYKITKR